MAGNRLLKKGKRYGCSKPGSHKPPQLRMFMTRSEMEKCAVPPVPAGFTLRNFREKDGEAYITLMRSAGFNWDQEKMAKIVSGALPEGIFFLEEDSSGTIVATAMANQLRPGEETLGGELGWVGVAPEFRGRRLGNIVCAAVVKHFLKAGYDRIFLKTDDFRIPAIKTYLREGWLPQTDFPETGERWQELLQTLRS